MGYCYGGKNMQSESMKQYIRFAFEKLTVRKNAVKTYMITWELSLTILVKMHIGLCCFKPDFHSNLFT
jgi:hypothetical protein